MPLLRVIRSFHIPCASRSPFSGLDLPVSVDLSRPLMLGPAVKTCRIGKHVGSGVWSELILYLVF